jgi:acyl-coenzyme A synthetase/AMP-(fatty) acid ligase
MYGLTEAFRSTYLPPEELDCRPTSMGKAIPDTEVMVVSRDGRRCEPGEVGELVHSGPTVCLGYWRRPEETAECYRPHPFAAGNEAERVVYSGDLVKLDEDGFLYFVGRSDGMIKSSGHRISPSEIEEVVFGSGIVKQAAAVGVADNIAGQIVKVFVTGVEDHDPAVLSSEIIDHCSSNLPSYMVPRVVEVIDPMPTTASGKIDYPALRQRG